MICWRAVAGAFCVLLVATVAAMACVGQSGPVRSPVYHPGWIEAWNGTGERFCISNSDMRLDCADLDDGGVP